MITTYGPVDQGRQGTATERLISSACWQRRVAPGGTEFVTRVWSFAASSVSIPRASRAARPSGRSGGSHGADHAQNSAAHGAAAARGRVNQWPHAGGERDARAGRVSQRSTKAWLRGAPGEALWKSNLTMRLTDCVSGSSPRPTTFWCPGGNAPPGRV